MRSVYVATQGEVEKSSGFLSIGDLFVFAECVNASHDRYLVLKGVPGDPNSVVRGDSFLMAVGPIPFRSYTLSGVQFRNLESGEHVQLKMPLLEGDKVEALKAQLAEAKAAANQMMDIATDRMQYNLEDDPEMETAVKRVEAL